VASLEIDWVLVAAAFAYVGLMWAALIIIAKPRDSHVLVLGSPRLSPERHGRPGIARGLIALAIGAAAYAAETMLIARYGHLAVSGLDCDTGTVLPLRCGLGLVAELGQPRIMALIGLVACCLTGASAWIWLRRAPYYPFVMLVHLLLAFGCAADFAVGSKSPASVQVLFGAVTTAELTAAAALALALVLARPLTLSGVCSLMLVYAAVAALRLTGLLAFAGVWTHLPSATAVSLLLTTYLLPTISACSAIMTAPIPRAPS
jgi:hypothetical protein